MLLMLLLLMMPFSNMKVWICIKHKIINNPIRCERVKLKGWNCNLNDSSENLKFQFWKLKREKNQKDYFSKCNYKIFYFIPPFNKIYNRDMYVFWGVIWTFLSMLLDEKRVWLRPYVNSLSASPSTSLVSFPHQNLQLACFIYFQTFFQVKKRRIYSNAHLLFHFSKSSGVICTIEIAVCAWSYSVANLSMPEPRKTIG